MSIDPHQADPAAWLAEQRRHAPSMLKRLLLTALADAPLAILQAALLAWLAANLLAGQGRLWTPALLLLLTLAVRALAGAARARFSSGAAADISLAVRERVAAALLRGAGGTMTPGEASTALLEQAEAVGRYHAGFAVQRRVASLATVLFLVAAFAVDWVVGLIFLCTAPLIPVFMMLVGTGAQRAADRQLESLRFLGGYFLDRLRGVLTLRAFAREQAERDGVDIANGEYRRRTMKVLRIAFLTSAVLELFAALSVALVALYVGLHLLDLVAFGPGPKLDFGTGLWLLLLAPEFYQPLRQLAAGYHDRAAAQSAAQVLAPLLADPADPDTDPGPAAPTANRPNALTLEGVGFGHGDGEPLFENLDTSVAAGQCLVLRGDSGTGKSTLLKVIAGLLPANGGRVLHDGQPAPQLARADGRLAWAGQHPWFVHGTVADNLRLVAPDADDADLERVLEDCGLGALPAGLATPLDENGGGLSGGQGRRLALARALLSPAPLLLLDEPTAELDEDLEARIVATLAARKGHRTLVIATHSPALAALGDHSIWLGGVSHD
ncbi:thiol reductant ABC exporter subunit CydD [Alloalcanivorax gelatiniphagus]|uniref:Thiol reductant ABC exporter subunit CydD n=2 Tax=Alloalcanivorax gelatiniphagus TaxID=1194167 RepID=A0ABY2XMT0_9GAMM|nr:thiol reductant ABC exporter subunit CydD [Alloalcanivorax gelatiniphagus]TMW13682.1 thiol reductant ABC exporter subunit CydD [Alloalcanivorax gelatiniphagus]